LFTETKGERKMRKILSILTATLLLICILQLTWTTRVSAFGPPTLEWQKTYGGAEYDSAFSVVQTNDGGYAIAGETDSFGAGSRDSWLVKTDAIGNAQWNKTYGGTGIDTVYSLIQTLDGGYAMVGFTQSFGAGGNDFWLVKTDAEGNMQWSKTYGGWGHESARCIVQTSDGGYAFVGYTYSFGAGSDDFWLVKTDENGTVQWSQTYGGASDDFAYSMVQTVDGGYAIVGGTRSFGAGQSDFWLVKTDALGNEQWNRTYGGTGEDWPLSVIKTNDGGYAIAGSTLSFGAGGADMWLVKVDSSGSMEWNQTYGGANDEEAWSVVETTCGGYVIAGQTSSLGAGSFDFWLVWTDADGNMEFNRTYGGANDDMACSMVQTSDGGYAVAGFTESFGTAGSRDFWLIKLAPPKIHATVDIDPRTLNLESKGKWVTGYIELPNGYNVADMDVSSILINESISVDTAAPTAIGDYDNDGIADLMVKFNRTAVSQLIVGKGIKFGNVTLTLNGELFDGTPFEGSDVIHVKMPGDVNGDLHVCIDDILLTVKAFGSRPGDVKWNPYADENGDGRIGIDDLLTVVCNFGKKYN
jgi:predicted secreted protein